MEQEKKDKLIDFLSTGEDWAKLEASKGLFIVKMPGKGKFKTSLALEVNPVNSEGKPIKRKGLYITNTEQLEGYIKAFTDPSIEDLMNSLKEINENAKDDTKATRNGKVVGKL